MTSEKSARPGIFFNSSFSAEEKSMVLPFSGSTLRSGSNSFEKERLKSLNPVKPESTMKRENAPANTPKAAMMVMILMALLLLLENKYRRAM